MDITKISIIGGLIITAINIIVNAIILIRNKKYEFKQLKYKTILECAYKEWEKKTDLINEISNKNKQEAEFQPFSEYIIYYSEFLKLMDKNNVSERDFEKFHKEVKRKTQLHYKKDE